MKQLIIIFVTGVAMQSAFALQMSPRSSQTTAHSKARTQTKVVRTTTTTTTTKTTATKPSSSDKQMLARVTVYWAGGKGTDRYSRKHKTSTGTPLRSGHCAVDPQHIPYGSKVTLPDGSSLAAVDTGTAVKNRKAARQSGRTVEERNAIVVDKFFETKKQALAWAKTHPLFMPIKVKTPTTTRIATPGTLATTTQVAPQPQTTTSTQTRVVTYNATAPVMKAQAVTQPTTKPLLVAKNNIFATSRSPASRNR
jgi:3D (Asp-Asp-Asp) domain-containing protein